MVRDTWPNSWEKMTHCRFWTCPSTGSRMTALCIWVTPSCWNTPNSERLCHFLSPAHRCVWNYRNLIHFVLLGQTLHPEQQRIHRRPGVPQQSHRRKSSLDARLHLGEQTGGASVCGKLITAWSVNHTLITHSVRLCCVKHDNQP